MPRTLQRECDELRRYASEARSRSSRAEGHARDTARAYWSGVAVGYDLSADRIDALIAQEVAEANRHAEHRCGWTFGMGCEVDTAGGRHG